MNDSVFPTHLPDSFRQIHLDNLLLPKAGDALRSALSLGWHTLAGSFLQDAGTADHRFHEN